MMEALGEAPSLSVESLITEESILEALRETLPLMNADTATLKVVLQKLAVRFGMTFADLKAQWRPRIKELLPDLLELCAGGDEASESVDKQTKEDAQDEEEDVDLRPSRTCAVRTGAKRNIVMDASDEEEEEDANDSDESEGEAAKPEDEEEEDDVAPVKKRQKTSDNTRKRKGKDAAPPAKKVNAAKEQDPPGLASLKELGRAAGILNPRLYRLLKGADSTEDAEEILRERLHDAGIAFHGSYPTSRDVSTAKREHDKAKELEGIDTSLIITGGRSRRGGAAPRISYTEERVSGEEDNAEEEEDEDDKDAEESAASDSDSSEASF